MVVGDGCVCHVSHGLFRGAEVDGDIDVSHGQVEVEFNQLGVYVCLIWYKEVH